MDEKSRYYLKMFSKFAIFAFILLGIFLAYKVAVFYIPFIIALIVASVIEPLIKLLTNKMKLKRKSASALSLLLIVTIIVILLSLLISSLISESVKLIDNIGVYAKDAYNFGSALIADVQEGRIEIPNEVMDLAQKSLGSILTSVQNFVTNFFGGIINTVTSIPTWLTYGFITVLAVIFICFDREYIITTCKKHIPSIWIEKAKMLFDQTCSVAIKYIKAEAKLSCICFILVLVGLILMELFGLNVEYTIIMAILIGFVDLLPLFGAGAVMIPWTVYLVIIGNIPLAIGVAALWMIWAIIKNLLEPKMISHQMGIHPIFTLIGMYTGFKLFGVLGLILGPIILLVFKNIFAELINKGVLKSIFEKE